MLLGINSITITFSPTSKPEILIPLFNPSIKLPSNLSIVNSFSQLIKFPLL